MDVNDPPPIAAPATLPYARPARIPPEGLPPGRAFAQIAIVGVVLVAWQTFYELRGADLVRAVLPGGVVYVHVVGLAVLTLAAVAIVTRRDPSRLAPLGLAVPPARRDVWLGLLFIIPCYLANFVVSSAYVLASKQNVEALAAEKMDKFDVLGSISLAAILPLSIFVGIYEELLFRGFLLSRLRLLFGRMDATVGAALAVLLSSLAFGLCHLYQGTLGVMQTMVVGIVLSIIAVRRRSIWACMVAHAGIDIFGLFVLKILGPQILEYLKTATQPA